jgi:hypothetical protein
MQLFEGGNIWPDTSEYEQTPEMVDGLVNATEEYLKELGLELHVIGSSYNPKVPVAIAGELIGYLHGGVFHSTDKKYLNGKIPDGAVLRPKKSGDLDVQTDLTQAAAYFKTSDAKTTKQALDDFLQAKGLHTKKAGVTVHTRIPFQNQFYQVDIKVIPKAGKVAAFHRHDIPHGSPYKGVNKQMVLNTLATSKGFLWSPDEGLYRRDAMGKKGEFLTDEPDEIAGYLLNKKDAGAIGSVESILAAIPNEAERNDILTKAKASASWQAATPDVGTNEWFVRTMRKLL